MGFGEVVIRVRVLWLKTGTECPEMGPAAHTYALQL
jgi:hypothetical protein